MYKKSSDRFYTGLEVKQSMRRWIALAVFILFGITGCGNQKEKSLEGEIAAAEA